MDLGLFERLCRFVLMAAIVASACITLWVGIRVGGLLMEGWWWPVAFGAALGVALVDLITGLVHWACDRLGSPSTPLFGPLVIRAFREHHEDPNAMLGHDWIETNGGSSILPLVALVALAWFDPQAESWITATGIACLWTMAAVGACANQTHKWAHASEPPRLIRWLQRGGLLLSPERHARHHHAAHDQAYCISTGWMNPLLDRVGVWSWLERSLKGTT